MHRADSKLEAERAAASTAQHAALRSALPQACLPNLEPSASTASVLAAARVINSRFLRDRCGGRLNLFCSSTSLLPEK